MSHSHSLGAEIYQKCSRCLCSVSRWPVCLFTCTGTFTLIDWLCRDPYVKETSVFYHSTCHHETQITCRPSFYFELNSHLHHPHLFLLEAGNSLSSLFFSLSFPPCHTFSPPLGLLCAHIFFSHSSIHVTVSPSFSPLPYTEVNLLHPAASTVERLSKIFFSLALFYYSLIQ